MTQPFSVGARVRSFRYAVRGLRLMRVTQHNARGQAVATVGVVGVGRVRNGGGVFFDFLL